LFVIEVFVKYSRRRGAVELVPTLEFMSVNIKSPKFFVCLNFSYTKSVVELLKFGFLACHVKMGRLSYPCIGQSKTCDNELTSSSIKKLPKKKIEPHGFVLIEELYGYL
jgi:hypothetical protein